MYYVINNAKYRYQEYTDETITGESVKIRFTAYFRILFV